MLYYFLQWLDQTYNLGLPPVYQYLSFRAGVSLILSLIISILYGKRIIRLLKKLQVGETVRDLGLPGQKEKDGTPTMGGILIILSILIPCLLMAKIGNIYIIVMIVATVWMGAIGFLDDYIKVFKKDKKGLSGKFKIVGQVGLGLIVGLTMLYHDGISVRMELDTAVKEGYEVIGQPWTQEGKTGTDAMVKMTRAKTTLTNVPFFKHDKHGSNSFDYAQLLSFLGDNAKSMVWLIFIPMIILVVTAVSNSANLTDGIDGLATGLSGIIGATLGVLAYLSGNVIAADYLNILYLPDTGELLIFSACFVGACIGFLWYNSFPAQVFMGDTGSLMLGGVIAAFAILIRKELLIPILCGVFLAETLSVMIQVSYFKHTKKKYGEGRRIFLMSPLHHHYQKKGMHEAKIVIQFWIVGILLAALTIITLKIR